MGRTIINQYLADRPRFPHGLHLVLTVCSCGLWLPVWLTGFTVYKLKGN